MKLYVALVDDRHIDPTASVFSTAEAAIEYARRQYEDHRPDDLDDEELADAEIGEHEPHDGLLYHATYSTEGDAVWVYETTLDVPMPI